MGRIDSAVASALAAISIFCSRHAKAVLATTLLISVVMGYGMSTITTNVDVADVLPRGNYNTQAAHELADKFSSTFTQQVTLQVHVDTTEGWRHWSRDNALLENRSATSVACQDGPPAPETSLANPCNITDEVYVRAIDEMVAFIQARTDFSRSISVSNIYNLINWTVAGGEDGGDGPDGIPGASESAFALPPYTDAGGAARYTLVDRAVKAAVLDTVDAIASPDWDHAATLFMPAADIGKPSKELGEQAIRARDEYVRAVDEGRTTFTVFGSDNPPLLTVDLPVANAHSSALVKEDSLKLLPIIFAFILVCLYIAFRNVRAIAVSFGTLAVGIVWSFGVMGFLGIPLNTLNMTIVPLLMGIGIDYSIHMINEFVEHKSEGHTDVEAFRLAGTRSGLAMLIASATTIGGLAVLIVSPSLLIAELGIVATVALTVVYLLTITFIPAALTAIGGSERMGARFTRSRLMPAIARGVSKARWVALAVILVVSLVAFPIANNVPKEAFGDPGRNYLEDDPVRLEHEQGLRHFYGTEESDEKANILTFSGKDVLTPEAIAYYLEIEANLKEQARVVPDTLRTVPFFINTWLTVKDGPTGAVASIVRGSVPDRGGLPVPLPIPLPEPVERQAEPFPTTREGIEAEVNAMFASPMRELSSIIINHPANDMAAMTFSVRAATYDEAEQVWQQVWKAVEAANASFGGKAPGDIRVAFVGNTATNYLFIAEELPWLTYMNVVGNIMLVVLVLVMTRSIRITFVTLLLSTITSLWWLALLPLFDIGLAITLVLPMAFIIAIGTDYGIHFMWNIKQTGNAREVFESTGKAVLFSFITTTGAFTFFIAVQNVAVSRTMFATMLAFLVIFAVTLLTIPAFFEVGPAGRLAPRRTLWQRLLGKGPQPAMSAAPAAPAPGTPAARAPSAPAAKADREPAAGGTARKPAGAGPSGKPAPGPEGPRAPRRKP